MADTAYRIDGTVIDRQTRQGVTGLRVQAWDRDTRYHDMLGQDITKSDGRFTIQFDTAYFGDYAPDRRPDVFFRVFLGDRLLLSTQNTPFENLRTAALEVTLEVDMPAPARAGKDRVSTSRAISAVEFLRQSDFRGVGRETADRFGMAGRVLGRFVLNTLAEMELEPLKGPSLRTRDVIGQDVLTAQNNLGAQKVGVSEVREYRAGDPSMALSAVTEMPGRVRPGESVVLYQQGGQVKYYSVVRQEAPESITAEDVARLDGEVDMLRTDLTAVAGVRDHVSQLKAESDQTRAELTTELDAMKAQVATLGAVQSELQLVRQQAAAKDQEIAALRRELTTLSESQKRLSTQLSPERLEKLDRLNRIEREAPGGPPVGRKSPRKPPR